MERIGVPPYWAKSYLTLFLVSTLLVLSIPECPVLCVRKIYEMQHRTTRNRDVDFPWEDGP